MDVRSLGERQRADRRGLRADVNAYVGEAGPEERLHLLAHVRRQRLPAHLGESRERLRQRESRAVHGMALDRLLGLGHAQRKVSEPARKVALNGLASHGINSILTASPIELKFRRSCEICLVLPVSWPRCRSTPADSRSTRRERAPRAWPERASPKRPIRRRSSAIPARWR